MAERVISEIILGKIEEKKVDDDLKEFVKEILDIERRHMLIRYPRYSEDYDRILSKFLARSKNENQKSGSQEF